MIYNTSNSRHDCRFEIYTFVSEILENVGLALGMNNIFELEGIINSRENCFFFKFYSILPKEQVILKPQKQIFIKIEALLTYELSGLVIVTLLDRTSRIQWCSKLSLL